MQRERDVGGDLGGGDEMEEGAVGNEGPVITNSFFICYMAKTIPCLLMLPMAWCYSLCFLEHGKIFCDGQAAVSEEEIYRAALSISRQQVDLPTARAMLDIIPSDQRTSHSILLIHLLRPLFSVDYDNALAQTSRLVHSQLENRKFADAMSLCAFALATATKLKRNPHHFLLMSAQVFELGGSLLRSQRLYDTLIVRPSFALDVNPSALRISQSFAPSNRKSSDPFSLLLHFVVGALIVAARNWRRRGI
jgi:hypothetical protein